MEVEGELARDSTMRMEVRRVRSEREGYVGTLSKVLKGLGGVREVVRSFGRAMFTLGESVASDIVRGK